MIFHKPTPHLLVIQLLQLGQSVNSLLSGAFLRVGQDVWMDLETWHKTSVEDIGGSKMLIYLFNS